MYLSDYFMNWYELIRYPLKNNYQNLWSGKVDIVRKDSGEIIQTIRVKLVEGKELTQTLLDDKLNEVLSKLELPDDLGNPDQVRLLFHEYDIFSKNREKYHQMLFLGIVESEISNVLASYEKTIIDYLLSFQDKYIKLPCLDKIRLIGGSDEEKKDYNLLIQRLTARNYFMKIIINPPQEITKAYQEMREIIKFMHGRTTDA